MQVQVYKKRELVVSTAGSGPPAESERRPAVTVDRLTVTQDLMPSSLSSVGHAGPR